MDNNIEKIMDELIEEAAENPEWKAIAALRCAKKELLKEHSRGRGKRLGRWKLVKGSNFVTPGGTPYYECGSCGNTGHLYGVEYPKRKIICDVCGAVNIYPWETAYEEGSSLWHEADEGMGRENG